MTDEQFQTLMEMLNEIKELLQQSQQPQTKITVVGNKVQSKTYLYRSFFMRNSLTTNILKKSLINIW